MTGVDTVYIMKEIFQVPEIHFKTQPGPLVKYANIEPLAGNRTRARANLVHYSVNSKQRP